MNDDGNDRTVFTRATDEPCPICIDSWEDGEILLEMVMPLPKYGPRNINGVKCCFDCQSAETVLRFGGIPTFEMARLAVGNERQESLRLPQGSAEHFGLCSQGVMRPSHQGQLSDHQAWLDSMVVSEI